MALNKNVIRRIYPPQINEPVVKTFIDNVLAGQTQSGDTATDFRAALVLVFDGNLNNVHKYSLDDAWKRYAQSSSGLNVDPVVYEWPGCYPGGFPATTWDIVELPGGSKAYGEPLDSYSLAETWTDGGANDLAALKTPMGAFKRFEGWSWSPDGTKLLVSNNSDGKVYSYALSTAWDLSTAVNNGFNSEPGAPCVGWGPSGLTYWTVNSSTDECNSWLPSAAYDLAEADTNPSDVTDIYMGSASVSDGGWFVLEDGSAIYAMTSRAGGEWFLSRAALSTTMDFNSVGAITEIDISADVGTPSSNSAFYVDPTETYVYAMTNTEVIKLGTMSTPGDVTTLTFSATTLNVSGNTGQFEGVSVADGGAAIWIWSTGISSLYAYKYS